MGKEVTSEMDAKQRVMNEPLPDTLEWLFGLTQAAQKAAQDAGDAALAAQGHAAAEAAQAEIDNIYPVIDGVRGTADKGLALAKQADLKADLNTQAIEDLTGALNALSKAVSKLREDLIDLGRAVVNGLKTYAEGIVANVKFLTFDKTKVTPDKTKAAKTE